MSKPASHLQGKMVHSSRTINEVTQDTEKDINEPTVVVEHGGDTWAFRLAMLAILGATLLMWIIVIFDFFAGMARGPAGPGGGRI